MGVVSWVDGHVSTREPSQYPAADYGPFNGLVPLALEFNLGDIDVDNKRDGATPFGPILPDQADDDVLFDYE